MTDRIYLTDRHYIKLWWYLFVVIDIAQALMFAWVHEPVGIGILLFAAFFMALPLKDRDRG
jgi:NADH:ubiquinone oxidoreductase subunit 3 (subunit A)